MTQISRRDWMGLLARAPSDRLAALMPAEPEAAFLRPPEIGTVMVRGRIGATGSAFNLGEMTVTRCTLQIASGQVGHAHIQGRDRDHARRAAVVDALMQTESASDVQSRILTPLAQEEAQRRNLRAAKAAATRVEFFTLVRGEDK